MPGRPRHPALVLAWKIASISLGGLLVLLGIVMLFTPGPGWLAILAGLAMLSPHSRMAKWTMLYLKQKLRLHHHEPGGTAAPPAGPASGPGTVAETRAPHEDRKARP